MRVTRKNRNGYMMAMYKYKAERLKNFSAFTFLYILYPNRSKVKRKGEVTIVLRNKKDCIKGVTGGTSYPKNQNRRCKMPTLTPTHFPNAKLLVIN